jgi:hypothetical protein
MSGHGTYNGTHIIYQVGGRQAERFLFVPPSFLQLL